MNNHIEGLDKWLTDEPNTNEDEQEAATEPPQGTETWEQIFREFSKGLEEKELYAGSLMLKFTKWLNCHFNPPNRKKVRRLVPNAGAIPEFDESIANMSEESKKHVDDEIERLKNQNLYNLEMGITRNDKD